MAEMGARGMVAGTDGSMDERTECMGAGYVVGDAEAPLMTLSLQVGGHWLLFVTGVWMNVQSVWVLNMWLETLRLRL
jgi:hypothetical protein